MRRRDLLLAGGATALSISAWPWKAALADDQPKRKVLMFTRSAGFEHSAIREKDGEMGHAQTVFTDLGKKHNFDVVATKDGRIFDEDLDQFDAFLFYTTGDLTQEKKGEKPPMSAAGKQKFLDAVAGGKGFVATHSGADTFHSPGHDAARYEHQAEIDPYIAMLGGEFISHGPQQEARMVVAAPNFPGAEELGQGFMINDEWYSLKNFADDLHVILVQDTQGMEGRDYQRPAYPATWARGHHDGRVFYTSMGHREDVWTSPTFQQVLLGGLRWTTGDVQADIAPNMSSVTPGARVLPKV